MAPRARLIVSGEEACANIQHFERELKRDAKLAEIMSYGRAWYGFRNAGSWRLGPSKFVGYAENDADKYLATHRERDGRLTERVLSQWFEEVLSGSTTYGEMLSAFRELFATHNRSPNRLFRLYAYKPDLKAAVIIGKVTPKNVGRARPPRITVDPEICFGRPCIRGMRIRVSDVLDLLAAGNRKEQILEDYPYLEGEDIDAVLEYAAHAVSHRVVKAA